MRDTLPPVRLAALALALLLNWPTARSAEPTPEVVRKFAEAKRDEADLLKIRVASLEENLSKFQFVDYSKDIAKVSARVKKLQAGIQARKKEGRSIKGNQKELDTAKEQLATLKSKDSSQKSSHKDMTDDLARCRSGLAVAGSLASTGPLFLPLGREMKPPSAGEIGTLYGQLTKVMQIIDDESMLITVSMGQASAIAMLKMPTKGLVDDTLLPSVNGKLFLVTGTHQYVAVTGAKRTVVALEEIDQGALVKAVAKFNAENK